MVTFAHFFMLIFFFIYFSHCPYFLDSPSHSLLLILTLSLFFSRSSIFSNVSWVVVQLFFLCFILHFLLPNSPFSFPIPLFLTFLFSFTKFLSFPFFHSSFHLRNHYHLFFILSFLTFSLSFSNHLFHSPSGRLTSSLPSPITPTAPYR